MKEHTLTVSKGDVMAEVAKTTNYNGAKKGDGSDYDKVRTVDEDEELLERFWQECKNVVAGNMKRVLLEEAEAADGTYTLRLGLSNAFDESLLPSMERSLMSYFVMGIAAKWYTYTNKEDVVGCATEAAGYMEDIMRKVYYKKKPTRPVY